MVNVEFWRPGTIHGDEYYTLREDAETIAEHLIKLPLKVWCPFNGIESVWPEVLSKHGFNVVVTDTDFFMTAPPDGVQCIISNPPFSKKRQVMDRIKELDLRFALILPFQWLNDGVPLEYGRQLMLFRKRMRFDTPKGIADNPRSNCFVLSDGLFIEDLIFVEKKRSV